MTSTLRDRDPTAVLQRCTVLLAAGLLVGCASTSQGSAADREGTTATSQAADRSSRCAGDCRLRVENRLDVDVEVGTERPSSLPDLGVVRANRNETFELPDFRGQHLEVWVRNEDTQEIVDVTCVRQFPRGTGRLIVGSEIQGGGC